MLDKITEKVLRMIDGEGFKQEGAFNLRENGISICHGDSEHVKIRKKRTGRELISILIKIRTERRYTFRLLFPVPE